MDAQVYDVYKFGAKGDGSTLDTEAIQRAIDECHKNGGGKVYVHSGEFVSGTVYLKSNVVLHVEAGARLRASNSLEDFPITPSKYPSITEEPVTNKMLIYAEDVENISILGRGTIDGNGDYWVDGPYGKPTFSLRPRIIHLRGCENIVIRDITLYNAASWVQSYQSCRNLVIDAITVNSRANKDIEKERFYDAPGRNNDGLDLIDCQQVRISNCFINSGDDAIVLKSFSPNESCSNIVVSNCVVSANASGIKMGTETAGGFRDINIQNCTIYDTRNEGIALLTADGAFLERINVNNITLRNIKGAAIAIRLGTRNRSYRKDSKTKIPYIRDISITNVQGTGISKDYGCNITGTAKIPVANIALRNISLEFEGGGNSEDAEREIPELEKAYPSGRTLGTIPAYGIYIRHAKNMVLENMRLTFKEKDSRPAIVADDVEQLEIRNLVANGGLKTPGLIRFNNVQGGLISQSRALDEMAVLLRVEGSTSKDILLLNNRLKKVRKSIEKAKDVLTTSATEKGTIR
ncbi:MAG: glycoside hydrolase family 28 protein [Bacteroidota bacterium]